MSNQIWVVVADQIPFAPLLAMAQGTGKQVEAVVVGPRERADAVAAAGADAVMWFEAGQDTPAESFAGVIAEASEQAAPCAIVSAGAASARVIVAAVAARMRIPIVPFITKLAFEDGKTVVEHAVAEGRSIEPVEVTGPVAGFIVDSADEPEARSAAVDQVTVSAEGRMRIVATHAPEGDGVDLADADRVVSVGRGFCAKEELKFAEDLADALKAELACSLPVCDNYHWFEHSRVVGTSTQKISPRLYVAMGISGQPQHMAGVRGAKTIVAINEDPEAPIFRECNYGIVGEFQKVAPVLTKAIAAL